MYYIDTHAHIYLPEFDDDRTGIVDRCQEAGVAQILLPAIDSRTHEQMLKTGEEFSCCKSMIGLHPCSVNQDFEQELKLIDEYLAQRKFIAIGEIGLDFYWDKTFTEQQYIAFERQIEIALLHQLPIAIHSRNATDECIQVVRKYPGIKGVFHCFSGTVDQARQIIDLGFLLGIGGVVTFKNAGLDKVLSEIDLSALILETDAPYLAPVPNRGKRNEPAYIPLVAKRLAELYGVPVEKIMEVTTENAEKLFNLKA